MSRPWMSFYVADYLADTGHLTTVQHGAYMLLIMHYWRRGGLPNDDRQLAQIARLSEREWQKNRAAVLGFFDGDLRHKRIDHELAHAEEISNKRSSAAKQKHGNSYANAEQKDTQPQPQSQVIEREGAPTPDCAISQEAFDLTDQILKATGEDPESPNWCGFPYTVQKWLAQKIPKEFALSVCANLPGKHRNYLDKAVENGWRDKQSEPARKHGQASNSVVDASKQLSEKIRAFTRGDPVRVGQGEPTVRMLSKG